MLTSDGIHRNRILLRPSERHPRSVIQLKIVQRLTRPYESRSTTYPHCQSLLPFFRDSIQLGRNKSRDENTPKLMRIS